MLLFDNRIWLLWAALLMLLPLEWLAAAAAAAFVHELFHAAAVIVLGGCIRSVSITPFGMVMQTEGIEGLREGMCALAGPFGSFCLSLCIRCFPMLGLCALVQGIFNLLPIYPMDGGRALLRLLEAIIPGLANGIAQWTERIVLLFLLCIGVCLSMQYNLGLFPLTFVVFLMMNLLLRKRP